jgi:alpha-N-arabinofuranosidase
MGNYIFPVNGHGLVKSVGEDEAYRSATYYVFELYRKYLSGNLAATEIVGPGYANARLGDYSHLDGDVAARTRELKEDLCFVDAAATVNDRGELCIAVVNRSHDKAQKVELNLPEGYKVVEVLSIESEDITAANTIDNRETVMPKNLKVKKQNLTLSPCGLQIVRCVRK